MGLIKLEKIRYQQDNSLVATISVNGFLNDYRQGSYVTDSLKIISIMKATGERGLNIVDFQDTRHYDSYYIDDFNSIMTHTMYEQIR